MRSGCALAKRCGVEGKTFRVVHERHKASVTVLVVAHEDGQLAAGPENAGRGLDEQRVPL